MCRREEITPQVGHSPARNGGRSRAAQAGREGERVAYRPAAVKNEYHQLFSFQSRTEGEREWPTDRLLGKMNTINCFRFKEPLVSPKKEQRTKALHFLCL